MSTYLSPYLHFRGEARDAMTFYESVLGGKLEVMTFADMGGMGVGDDEIDLVMHSALTVSESVLLMAADVPRHMEGALANGHVALSGDEAEVQAGSFRVRAALSELELRAAGGPKAPEGAKVKRREGAAISLPRVESPGMEVDLRGQRVEEVLPALDRYLDEAFVSGLPRVRIIHGKGTGALRRAVRDELRRHPLVSRYRQGDAMEGGDGVTVAELAQ